MPYYSPASERVVRQKDHPILLAVVDQVVVTAIEDAICIRNGRYEAEAGRALDFAKCDIAESDPPNLTFLLQFEHGLPSQGEG